MPTMTDSPVDKKRGERIRHLRENDLRMRSQRELAEALTAASPQLPPLTRGAVGNWELGKDISIDNARRIVSFAASRDVIISIDWIYQGRPTLQQDVGAASADATAHVEKSRLEEVSALAAALSEADALTLFERLSARMSSAIRAKSGRVPAQKTGAKAK